MKKLKSWAGNVVWRPKAVHRPKDEQDIAELVTRVAEEGVRLKPVGSGLSWSDINEVEGQHLLLLDRMTAIDVQADARRVRVQGGAVMSDIQRTLAEHHLALDNIGSIVTQTAAGYTGTGTHGSGTPILSTFIEKMRLVDGTGCIRELSPSSNLSCFLPHGSTSGASAWSPRSLFAALTPLILRSAERSSPLIVSSPTWTDTLQITTT